MYGVALQTGTGAAVNGAITGHQTRSKSSETCITVSILYLIILFLFLLAGILGIVQLCIIHSRFLSLMASPRFLDQ